MEPNYSIGQIATYREKYGRCVSVRIESTNFPGRGGTAYIMNRVLGKDFDFAKQVAVRIQQLQYCADFSGITALLQNNQFLKPASTR